MELVVEELEKLKRKLKITIPKEVVSERIDQAYKDLNRQITMPGFRPGKIPRKILEKQVPVQSFTDMLQDLMQEYYDKALIESGIKPAGQPEIEQSDLANIEKDKPMTFSVILESKPEFESKLKDYKGVKLKKKIATVDEKELENVVHGIVSNHGHFEHHEDSHEIQMNDHLVIDFEGAFDGEALEGGSHNDYPVRVGEKKMIEGFEEQLVGHKLGEEFELKVRLPASYGAKVRRVSMPIPGAGDAQQEDDRATFHVKIKEVKNLVAPELTDDIAAKEGFESVDAFKRAVKTQLQGYKEQQEELRIKEELFNRIVKENDVEPAEATIDRELKFMIEGMKYQIEESGMKVEDSGFEPERAKTEWREKALFNSKGYMILEGLANKEGIRVTQDDLDKEYEKLAEAAKIDVEQVKANMMQNPDSLSQTSSKLLGKKMMDYLYSHCEFEYVKELEAEATPSAAEDQPV